MAQSTVGGSMVKQGGGATIRSNRRDVPAPTGSGNVVGGNKKGQCRNL
ncbi:MAG: hypothetical protein H0W46_10175 [Acidimicrobiia bacterium]|nr:hypothetical protein [Acidimicrobiia bacterium]